MKSQFKKMTQKQMDNMYGGTAWFLAVIPFILQSLVSAVASIKMLASDNGSVKYNGMQSSWSQNKTSASKGDIKEYYYDI